MKHNFSLNKECGISLIETLIALLITGLVLVAFMITQSQNHLTVSATQRHSVAVHLAQKQLESLKRMDDSACERNDPEWANILASPPIIDSINGVTYRTTTTLIPNSDLPNNIQNNVKIIPIRVTVSWQEPGGAAGPANKSISMNTFYHP